LGEEGIPRLTAEAVRAVFRQMNFSTTGRICNGKTVVDAFLHV
jgi:hypothetical protein